MNQECYFSCHAPAASSPEESIAILRAAFIHSLAERGYDSGDLVLLRFFCSDAYTQAPLLDRLWPEESPCQRVYIGQAPQDSAFISLQAYCIAAPAEKYIEPDGSLLVRHGSYQSLYTLEYPPAPGSSREQADAVITALRDRLKRRDLSLGRDVLRTWYYVRDVDNNYAEMVQSRVDHYEACGLTPSTHFIASTGIEACAPRPYALVWLHSYAEQGLQPEQVSYLKALDYLSPTHVYGVNFERATRVIYGDRAHCHISGTASIDHEGNVLHKGDIIRQVERAVENIEALLREGDMDPRNLKAATVYLRDSHDYPRVASMVKSIFPSECAVNITHGPVCRPDWLVEIEGEAVAPRRSAFAPFL